MVESKHTIKPKSLLIVFCFIFFIIGYQITLSETDCNTLSGDAKDECINLEKKAKVYQELIDLKNKQQNTLSQQLQTIDIEQEKNRVQLQETQRQVDDLDTKIKDLEKSIQEKQREIDTQKKILTGLMQTYYEYDQQGVLNIVLINKDFSDTLSQSDYLEQSGVKVSEILSTIKKNKSDLMAQSNELNDKREAINKLKETLADKKDNLQSSESQKESLLDQTQGEEQKYQGLLARVEEEKKDLFNFSQASNLGEIKASVKSYPKPSTNLASTSWYFSQLDSRWGNQRIGNSSSTMEDYGCAVTSLSMVFRKMGSNIDPGKMAKQRIFYYDLIKWPSTWSPGITLSSSISHGNIKWPTIDSQIKKGNPVIVYIKKTNGGGGHYVVVTGKDSKDYIVHDPYFGPNLYLGTSKSLVGKIGIDSKVVTDQMIVYN